MMMSVVWLVFAGLVATVAVTDLATYRIPNWGALALGALFAIIAVMHGTNGNLLEHVGAAALCLVAGFGLFAARQVGAGDAKLLSAVALFSGFSGMIPLLFLTALAGLAELTVILILRRLVRWAQARSDRLRDRPVPRVFLKRQPIPLGAAIAVGAIFASYFFPTWLWFA